jgi:glycosyltransferase involved in cell wall biosynthesis
MRRRGQVLEDARPDCILIVCDPGSAHGWLAVLAQIGQAHIPTVLYAPVEGAPIGPMLAAPFRLATRAFTPTAWAARVLAAEHGLIIPHVPHGVDTTVFRPLDPEERAAVREEMGWAGKYVVAYVARNIERKAHDRLIKAVAMLHRQGMTDLHLYLHCKPNDLLPPRGFDLAGIARWAGVAAHVQFAVQDHATQGEPSATFAQKLAAADLYVSPSKVEGFGLPLLEALACGLPVCIPADGGNQEEVTGPLGIRIPVADWDTWFTGAQLACVAPEAIAGTIDILRTKRDPAQLAAHAAKGPAWAAQFSWEHMANTMADAVAEAVDTIRSNKPSDRGTAEMPVEVAAADVAG